MKIPLEEDIVRFDYIQSNVLRTEYFIYPSNKKKRSSRVRNNNNKQKRKINAKQQRRASRRPNRLNLMYIMIDSISRASAQRYLNVTYKSLDEDPNTVIMKVCIYIQIMFFLENSKIKVFFTKVKFCNHLFLPFYF